MINKFLTLLSLFEIVINAINVPPLKDFLPLRGKVRVLQRFWQQVRSTVEEVRGTTRMVLGREMRDGGIGDELRVSQFTSSACTGLHMLSFKAPGKPVP